MSKKHKVRDGECVSSIAFKYGFFPNTIWDHDDNAELKNKRKVMHLLSPGDMVVVPEKEVKKEIISSDTKHRYIRKGVPEVFKLCLLDKQNTPRIGVAYRLDLDGLLHTGETNDDGFIIESIPPDTQKGLLIIGEGDDEENIALDLGVLNPVSETRGIQQRLNNLGYDCGAEDNIVAEKTLKAMNDFQLSNQLPTTDCVNEVTAKEIEKCHGS